MLISVDFWKSMHGFAMDSRTRGGYPFKNILCSITTTNYKVLERRLTSNTGTSLTTDPVYHLELCDRSLNAIQVKLVESAMSNVRKQRLK